MDIWIGNDHGGYDLKRRIVDYFSDKGYSFTDVGTNSEESVKYPYYAEKVSTAVADGLASKGILICATGIGMSIIANKFKGIRAALCTSSYMAKVTRLHNDSNILCLGGQITGVREAIDIVGIWLSTGFEGGRHSISLGLIESIEDELLTRLPFGESVMMKKE